MKKLLLMTGIAAMLVAFGSCKKLIEQKEKDAILAAMTQGRWFVEQYKDTTADVTGEFWSYEFQFYEDYKVDAIKGSTVSSGTWSADISKYTITANFPPTANDTLRRLNYTWKLTDSYTDYVEAKTTTSSGDNILHLRKK